MSPVRLRPRDAPGPLGPVPSLVLGLVVLLLGLAGARGETRQAARLSYERPAGVENCPAEATVRDAVAARLGYDPFRPAAERTVTARIQRVPGAPVALFAVVELRDAAGKVVGTRSLASQDCAELAAAMALAVSIAIDPLVLSRPQPANLPPVVVLPLPAPPPPPPAPPPRPSPARRRVFVRARLGALATLGAAPTIIGGGFTAQVGLRVGLFSLGLEGRADVPVSAPVEGLGSVQTSLLLATLVPCLHFRFVAGCALASAGALQGSGAGISAPLQQTTFYAAAGARLGLEFQVHRLLWLTPHLDLQATLTRTTLRINGQEAWTTPPLSGALGFALLGAF